MLIGIVFLDTFLATGDFNANKYSFQNQVPLDFEMIVHPIFFIG